jgi:hypothetical protein
VRPVDPSTGRRAALACGVLGPGAFVGAWVAGGVLRRDGYSPVSQAISQLARIGSPARPLMTAGFVAFGLLVPAYAGGLRAVLGPRAAALRAAATTSGLATLAVAALPLSRASGQPVDTWHAVAAGTGYLAQVAVPLAGARLLPAPRASYAVSGLAAACLVGSLAVPELTGLLQRAGLTAVDAWLAAVAVGLLRAGPEA